MPASTRPRVPLGDRARRLLAAVGTLAVLRAVALVLIADGLATAIAAAWAGDDARLGVGLAVGGVVLRAVASWLLGVVTGRAAAAAKRRHRGEVTRRIAAGADADAGDVVAATTGLDALDAYYTGVIPAVAAAVVVPVTLGVRILTADWVSALIVGVTIPLVPLFMVLIGLHTRDRVAEAESALARLAHHVAELAAGLPVLVGLGRQREQARALAGIQRAHTERTTATLRTAFLSALALELIATLSVAVVAVFLGVRLLDGGVALSAALLVLLLAPEVFGALRELGASHHASQDGVAAWDRVRALLERAVPGRRQVAPGDDLRLDGLTVRHAGRRDAALAPVSATLRSGRVTAIVGPSGAGKSTLLAAVAGVLPASAEVGGLIRGLGAPHAASPVAYAPQSPAFAADTVEAEIALAGGDAAVLGELGIADLAAADPITLSPGEQRRLAVARALARVDAGATVLVLDEPTAHLDAAAAARVTAAVARRRVTTLLASHEPATLALADDVLALGERPASAVEPAVADDEAASRAARPAARLDPPRLPLRAAMRLVIAPARGAWIGSVALGVAATALGLALTAVSGWLIVQAAEQPAIMYLLVAIVGVRFFGLGRSVARYAERLVTHRAVFAATDALRLRLWDAIAARSAGSRDLAEGGAALDYLVVLVARVRDLLPRVVTPIATGVVVAIAFPVVVALIDPVLGALAAATAVLALLVPALVVVPAGRAAERDRTAAGSALARGLARLAAASADLRGNGGADRAAAAVDARARRVETGERRTAGIGALGASLAALVTGVYAAVAVLLVAGGVVVLPADRLAVVALLGLAVAEPLAAAVVAAQRVPALGAALDRLGLLLAAPEPVSASADVETPRGAAGGPRRELPGPVRWLLMVGLTARWPGAPAPVAAPVDADVSAPGVLVLDGPSGSGKSTLLSVLLGGLDADTGRLLANGVDVAELEPTGWSGRVAWCPQEAHVFDSSIRGNLLVARPRTAAVDDAEMLDVLDRVGLGGLVADLESGLDGAVGPRGRSLSGGERQRLAVARALLADADLLLLDEPTAHLDAATADALIADVRRAAGDRIVVLVSHRLADRRPEDVVVRLRPAQPVAV